MPPGIRLEITVDDKGSPVVRQFNTELGKTPASVNTTTAAIDKGAPAVRQYTTELGKTPAFVNATTTAIDKSTPAIRQYTTELGRAPSVFNAVAAATDKGTSSFTAVAGSALRTGAAVVGITTAVKFLVDAFVNVAAGSIQLEAALANVNTLGIRSVETQQRLRTELLQLPPALGSSTDLARGLYEVLSSGIAPTQAVQFLGEAAKLAQAGLAQLDTSTVALTKTMAAYNLPAEQAGRISDILFKTVEIGQGSLQQFAGALPQVTQLAASMGLSLEDTANAMATLSQTFRNADTAATGFRSLLQQLLQNGDKFLALGINIREVISEGGLLGAVRVLQQVSQGSSERLRLFVNDIEGFNAALALTGPQFQTLVTNQQKFQQASGAVAEGLRQQANSTAGAWREFTGTIDRSVQALGPAVTSVLTGIIRAATTFAQDLNRQVLSVPMTVQQAKQDLDKIAPGFAATLRTLLTGPAGGVGLPLELSAQRLHEQLSLLSPAAQKATVALSGFNDVNVRATQLLDEGLKRLEQWPDESDRTARAVEVQAQALKITNLELQAFDAALAELTKRQSLTTGQVRVFAQTLEDSLRGAASSGTVSLKTLQDSADAASKAVSERLGQLTPGLRQIVTEIGKIGEAAPVGLGAVTRVLKEVDEQGHKTLRTVRLFGEDGKRAFDAAEAAVPRVTQAVKELNAQGQTVLRTVEVFGPATEEAFARRAVRSVKAFDAALAESAAKNALIFAKFGADSREALATLREEEIRVQFELGNISRSARDAALALQRAGREGGDGIATGVTEGAEQAKIALASTAQAATEVARLTRIVFQQDFGDNPRQLFEQLAQQRQRISNSFQIAAAAGLTEPGNFEAYRRQIIDSANDAIYFILQRLQALGYDASGRPIQQDPQLPPGLQSGGRGGGGTGTSVTSSPAGFGGDNGGGGVSSIPANTGGGVVGTFGQFGPSPSSPLAGGNETNPVVTRGGTSINIVVNAAALTGNAAQDLANNLAPALRELQRRGQL